MKMHTRKIAAKRFKISAGGKIMRRRQNSRHLRSHKSKSQLRKFRVMTTVSKGFTQAVRIYLPYS